MAEYIERESLLNKIIADANPDGTSGVTPDIEYVFAIAAVETAPAADVAPVVHGRWSTRKITDDHTGSVSYSHFHDDPKCKYYYVDSGYGGHYYCPNCGAKMDGK